MTSVRSQHTGHETKARQLPIYENRCPECGDHFDKLHAFVQDKGYQLRGKQDEEYLGDPRRTAPQKLKTVIRQPVESAQGS